MDVPFISILNHLAIGVPPFMETPHCSGSSEHDLDFAQVPILVPMVQVPRDSTKSSQEEEVEVIGSL